MDIQSLAPSAKHQRTRLAGIVQINLAPSEFSISRKSS
jgi:hypothetical protein